METPLTDAEKKAHRAEINRANAQKSTGPKTEAGKASSRRNGLKHGRRSQFIDYATSTNPVLLPGESMVDYSRILEGLMAKLSPRDPAEKEIIYRIAASQWELIRFRCIRMVLLEDQFQTVADKIQNDVLPSCAGAIALARAYQAAAGPGGGFSGLRLDIAAVERSIAAGYREFKQLRSLDPFLRPPADFNPATDIAQEIYTSRPESEPEPEPDEAPPAAPQPNPQTVENTEAEPTETPEINDNQSQPEPTPTRLAHGYSIVLPTRRAPQRAEPPLKVRHAGAA